MKTSKVVPPSTWINVPKCVVDCCAELLDRMVYVETRTKQHTESTSKHDQQLKETERSLKSIKNDITQDLTKF